jgi:hypothetical protein
MRKRLISVLWVVLIYILFGCSGSPFGRVLAPSGTPAFTDTRTSTPLPTATPSPASTLTSTREPLSSEEPAGSCRAQDGTWTSKEKDLFGPTLTFRVDKCRIASIKIWVYLVDGELYTLDTQPELPIVENAFEYSEGSGAGKLILSGVFESAGNSSGTMTFTKGFDIFGTVLSKDVVIPWTAKPL